MKDAFEAVSDFARSRKILDFTLQVRTGMNRGELMETNRLLIRPMEESDQNAFLNGIPITGHFRPLFSSMDSILVSS